MPGQTKQIQGGSTGEFLASAPDWLSGRPHCSLLRIKNGEMLTIVGGGNLRVLGGAGCLPTSETIPYICGPCDSSNSVNTRLNVIPALYEREYGLRVFSHKEFQVVFPSFIIVIFAVTIIIFISLARHRSVTNSEEQALLVNV